MFQIENETGYLLVSGDIEEEVLVLGCRVLGSVRARVTHHHHDGLVGPGVLGGPEEGDGVVGDEVWKVVFGVVEPVCHLLPVDVQAVVVKLGVANQTGPLVPTLGYPGAVIPVQIFAEITCKQVSSDE